MVGHAEGEDLVVVLQLLQCLPNRARGLIEKGERVEQAALRLLELLGELLLEGQLVLELVELVLGELLPKVLVLLLEELALGQQLPPGVAAKMSGDGGPLAFAG